MDNKKILIICITIFICLGIFIAASMNTNLNKSSNDFNSSGNISDINNISNISSDLSNDDGNNSNDNNYNVSDSMDNKNHKNTSNDLFNSKLTTKEAKEKAVQYLQKTYDSRWLESDMDIDISNRDDTSITFRIIQSGGIGHFHFIKVNLNTGVAVEIK